MSEASAAPASPSAETGNGISVGPSSLESRSAAAFGLPDPAADGVESSPPADGAPAVGSVEPDAAAAQQRAERRAALARMQSEERQRVDAMAAMRERDEWRQKYAALEAQAKGRDGHIDPSTLTPEQYFALGEKLPNLSPSQLGEWLRERMANPEIAAANAATRAVDPKLSALEQKLAAQQAVIDNFMKAQESAKEQAEEAAAAHEFFQFTAENAATSPFSAAFLREHGPDEFLKLAQRAVQDVPAHGGAQAILDEIEENLAQLGRIYRPQQADPQRRQASPPPQYPAAAQAPTTVSNTLAQQRSSVVDEDGEWAQLPFEERSARLFR